MANIGRMSAGLSHQFSTPISVLSTSLDLLEDDLRSEQLGKHKSHLNIYFKNMRETLSDMINLTTFIKQLSRVGARKIVDQQEFATLVDVISHSLGVSKQKLHNASVNITWEPKDFCDQVYGNHLLLSQVFLNLIENSLFELKSLQEKWIKIWAVKSEKELLIYFQDSGITPNKDVCFEMFTPFFSTKDLSQGTGLGLALCKEILNSYNGEIKIIGGEVHTTFLITLKVKV